MGFKSVYRVLMDVFPQVDSRILRAVAIENSKDADKAVEVVLMEVIPQMANTSASENNSLDSASHEENTVHSSSKTLDEIVGLSEVALLDDGKALNNASREETTVCSNTKTLDEIVGLFKVSSPDNRNGDDIYGLSTNLDGANLPSNLECLVQNNRQQFDSENDLRQANDEVSEATCISDFIAVNRITVTEEIDSEHVPMEKETVCKLVDFEKESMEVTSTREVVEFENNNENTLNFVAEVIDSEQVSMEVETVCKLVDFEKESMEVTSTREVVEFENENENENALNIEVSSGQMCRINLLEDIIREARDNKKTLFSAMESVLSLMKEVEVREREAEQTKEETARGPLDVLDSVENLKQMLQHAREANDMHAGEVYGEKAILATEAKELQSRLLCLSDERDNSLAILDEMLKALEDRLDAAEEALKAAQQEKMEKEECARKALTEQQLIMDKLVQDSKMLKQEAEENSKLQEFLMDRGSVVDILQGEISVIFHDIKLLKQKFDERVPLSESLSSSQTSYRLASSSSSVKSLPLELPVEIEKAGESPKRTSPTPSISDHLCPGEERVANDQETLVEDDGWELCDNKELNM